MTDWTEIERQNPGEPPWWVLALTIRGETPTTHQGVFAAISEGPNDEPVRVLIAVEYGDAESDVITPWEIPLRRVREGISHYRILGATKEEHVRTAVGPDQAG